MMPDTPWRFPLIPAREGGNGAARHPFPRIVNPALTNGGQGKGGDRASVWLRNAMIALAVLAAAAAAVSFEAQYVLVRAVKHAPIVAGIQAGIPDTGAAVFACLGIALALQGKRAIRTRVLNLACIGISVAMNALAVVHGGWRPLAVWVMAPTIYALASDTLIGVVRAWSIARQRELTQALADDEATPIAALGGIFLWLLRLSLAPKSTLAGFRRWVVEECPVAPGRREAPAPGATAVAAAARPAITGPVDHSRPRRPRRGGDTKTGRFLALVIERHGPLAELPLGDVSRIASHLAPEVDLNVGSARSVLRSRVREAQPSTEITGGSA